MNRASPYSRDRIEAELYPVGQVKLPSLLASDPLERVRQAISATKGTQLRPYERVYAAIDLFREGGR